MHLLGNDIALSLYFTNEKNIVYVLFLPLKYCPNSIFVSFIRHLSKKLNGSGQKEKNVEYSKFSWMDIEFYFLYIEPELYFKEEKNISTQ